MSKKIIGVVFGLLLGIMVLPQSAAATPPPLQQKLSQSQISAIIALLQSFGAEQSVINNVSISLGGGTPGNSGSGVSCIELSYNLFSGSTDGTTGGQVTKLQRFLGVSQTGYFGPETEAAVQRWQAANGIVSSGSPDTTGYGYVGTKTRAAMARGCNGSTTSDVIFGATPTYGTAPLFVKFSTNQKSGVIYYDKGAFMASCLPDEAERGSCDFSLGHGWTYKTPGMYTATLTTACPTNEPNCSTRVLGTKIITVTGQTTNTPSATVDTPVVTPITGSNRFDVALTGSALNFGGANKGNQLYNWTDIVVVPSTYRGSLDLRVIGRMHDETVVEGSSNAEVRNGRWAHSFNLGVGTHKVLVYDYYGDTSMPITTRTITVTDQNKKTASIDQDSLTVRTEKDFARVTITGAASNVQRVTVSLKTYADVSAPVVNGRWSATLSESLPTGTYPLQIINDEDNTVLTTGTLVVKTNMQTRDVQINSFTISPSSVRAGEVVTFAWSSNLTQNDVSQYGGGCSIEGITKGNVALNVTWGFIEPNGQIGHIPQETAVYTLRCSSSAKDGSAVDTKQITVNVY